MNKRLGLFFVFLFLISIILSTSESVKSKLQVITGADKYSASISPIKATGSLHENLVKK
jgi:hypothetical protein